MFSSFYGMYIRIMISDWSQSAAQLILPSVDFFVVYISMYTEVIGFDLKCTP